MIRMIAETTATQQQIVQVSHVAVDAQFYDLLQQLNIDYSTINGSNQSFVCRAFDRVITLTCPR